MTPQAELLLSIARDVQLIEEATLPAMRLSDVVLADRYLYTAEVLAEHGRGLPRHAVSQILRSIGAPVEPDLVVLIDVDPHLARARRKVAKLLVPEDRPGSRKGLAGAGIQHRMRAGYQALALRDPARWAVIDNTNAALEDVEEQIGEALLAAREHGVAHARAMLEGPRSGNGELSAPNLWDARRVFFRWVDERARREPQVAAYLLGGLAGPGIDERRIALADHAPCVIAHGLRGLDDEVSWRLRGQLSAVVPHAVAASLGGEPGLRGEAMSLRAHLCADAPAEIASSLRGNDDGRAWLLRSQLHSVAPLGVLGSLATLGSSRAWIWRETLLARLGGESALENYDVAAAVCRAITGLEDDRAWALREEAYHAAPVDAVQSLAGCASPRARDWRERHVERAPKAVMKSIGQMTDEHSWELREQVASASKEALDSIYGLDCPRAWWLRARCRDLWPSTVAGSMGTALARSGLGMELWSYLLANHGGIALLRAATGVAVESS